jgi:HPr kinase/phosphorylase
MSPFNIHATTVAIAGRGILIRGKPGSGKSELALRLIDAAGFGAGEAPLRATLVADDQTMLRVDNNKLLASPPKSLAGLIELRGQGLLHLPFLPEVPVDLVVDLREAAEIERLPEEHLLTCQIAGVTVPRIALDQTQPAAPAIVRMILTARLGLLVD